MCEGSVSSAPDASPVDGGGGSERDMLCPARTCERDRGGGGVQATRTYDSMMSHNPNYLLSQPLDSSPSEN